MNKSKVAALLAVAPWALVASTSIAVAQVENPLPQGSVPLPGAPTKGGGTPGNAPQVTVLPRGDTVATRARPEYDPLGIRAGSFLFFPQLSVDELYNDNIFATDGGQGRRLHHRDPAGSDHRVELVAPRLRRRRRRRLRTLQAESR